MLHITCCQFRHEFTHIGTDSIVGLELLLLLLLALDDLTHLDVLLLGFEFEVAVAVSDPHQLVIHQIVLVHLLNALLKLRV